MKKPFDGFPHVEVNEWDYEQRKVNAWNATEGRLHLEDGIDCPVCKNKGFIERLSGNPEKDRFPEIRVEKCACMRKRELVANAKAAGLGDMFGKKFADYRAYEPWQIEAKKTAVDYAKNPSGWFCALGQVGSGKTLLASCVANQLLRDGKKVLVKSWPELARKCEASWYGARNEALDEARRAEVLYIDDLFKDGCKGRSEDIAFQILDYRARNKMLTIITSEMLLPDLLELNEGLYSRIKMYSYHHLVMIEKDKCRDQRQKVAEMPLSGL